MPTIEARGIYHIFRTAEVETIALRGADLSLDAGTWTSLVGPSGSGKSTLVHIVAGLLEPSAGQVLLDGEDLTRLPPAARATRRGQQIGVVLQRDNLHPLLDVQGNVDLPLRLQRVPRNERRARVRELLTQLGIDSRRRHRPSELSGGEAQRVAVAVALANRPQILLADEPTGELDQASAVQVLDLLREACSRQIAVLTVTHNPEVAARADRRLTMRDGLVGADA
jgi:ABC-type lipoprotein export system ATPase subunit